MNDIKTKFSQVISHRVTIGTMYRLLISEILPNDIEKVIYLDSDIIVHLDITELWKIQLLDKPLAAVPEILAESAYFIKGYANTLYILTEKFVAVENYFNAGVLVLNLAKFRKEKQTLQRGMEFIFNAPQYVAHDQDFLNYCFANDYVHLPKIFDRFTLSDRIEKCEIMKAIYHFSGPVGMSLDLSDRFSRLWFSYFEKTPWFNSEMITHIYEELLKLNVEQKNFSTQISALMSGKSRAFFTPAPNVDGMKKIFYIRDDEEIIPAVNQNSFIELVNSMKNSVGKKIYFILIGGYENLRAELTRVGFVEGRDFVNAVIFLSNAHGVSLDTYNFIKAL